MRFGALTLSPGGLWIPNSPPLWTPLKIAGLIEYWQFDQQVGSSGGHAQTTTGLKAGTVLTWGAGVSGNQPVQQTWAAGNNTTALYFDGNDYGQTAAAVVPSSGDMTTFVIGDFFDTSTGRAMFYTSTSGGILIAQDAAGNGKVESWGAGVSFNGDGSAVTTPLSLVSLDTIGADRNNVFYRNGVSQSMAAPHTQVSSPTGRMTVGSTNSFTFFHKGYIYAIGCVTGRMSAGDLASFFAWSLRTVGV